ncbi:hypothetical protein EVAR_53857_1 [Eumeta japonica]|uniref:Uncharacterized protein n=1 Tax=Eumeta variegata TaxID=151549 RepID=A0A4C1XIG1_EUMVA|nr:hypothetical protein EVAR_53857_1 [Eumeta japonica]
MVPSSGASPAASPSANSKSAMFPIPVQFSVSKIVLFSVVVECFEIPARAKKRDDPRTRELSPGGASSRADRSAENNSADNFLYIIPSRGAARAAAFRSGGGKKTNLLRRFPLS